MKTFLVSNDLHCNVLLFLMIEALKGISKWTFSQFWYDLISIPDMISKSELIFSCVIVKVVILITPWWLHSIWHFSIKDWEKVNSWIVKNLCQFKIMEILFKIVKHIMHTHWKLKFKIGFGWFASCLFWESCVFMSWNSWKMSALACTISVIHRV